MGEGKGPLTLRHLFKTGIFILTTDVADYNFLRRGVISMFFVNTFQINRIRLSTHKLDQVVTSKLTILSEGRGGRNIYSKSTSNCIIPAETTSNIASYL